MEIGTALILIAAAFLAGFIDSQVGGGGVITLPALLALGVPPHVALGTNKLAATGASTTAAIQYIRAKLVARRDAGWAVPLAFFASIAGALIVLNVPEGNILVLVLAVMLAMTIYVLVQPKFGSEEKRERRLSLRRTVMVSLLVLLIGFYDGFLGPGTGSLFLFALVGVWGYSFLQAAALGRVLNWATNVGALVVFAALGFVDWRLGLLMWIGTVSGAWVGSNISIRGGSKWIRVLFVAVTLVLIGRLAWTL